VGGGGCKDDGIANVLVGHDGISTIKPAKGKGRGFVATFNIFQGTPTLLEEPLFIMRWTLKPPWDDGFGSPPHQLVTHSAWIAHLACVALLSQDIYHITDVGNFPTTAEPKILK